MSNASLKTRISECFSLTIRRSPWRTSPCGKLSCPGLSFVPRFLPRHEFRRLDLIARKVALVQTEQFAFGDLAEALAVCLLDMLLCPPGDVSGGLFLVHVTAHDLADDVAQRRPVAQPERIG